MYFVHEVMEIAQLQNHHPRIVVEYGFVTVAIMDHELGRVSYKCIQFMKAIDQMHGKI